MADLIDRQAAIDALGERPMSWTDSDYELGSRNRFDIDRLAIDTVPSVDAVPVVRCKDCTYSRPFNGVVIQCTRYADSRLKTDYCSYGERKDGEQHG